MNIIKYCYIFVCFSKLFAAIYIGNLQQCRQVRWPLLPLCLSTHTYKHTYKHTHKHTSQHPFSLWTWVGAKCHLNFIPAAVRTFGQMAQGGPKKVIPHVQCNTLYVRYHFFGPPGRLDDLLSLNHRHQHWTELKAKERSHSLIHELTSKGRGSNFLDSCLMPVPCQCNLYIKRGLSHWPWGVYWMDGRSRAVGLRQAQAANCGPK